MRDLSTPEPITYLAEEFRKLKELEEQEQRRRGSAYKAANRWRIIQELSWMGPSRTERRYDIESDRIKANQLKPSGGIRGTKQGPKKSAEREIISTRPPLKDRTTLRISETRIISLED